eukprot:12089-Heterococcus_DN1.PRE.1
MVSRRHNEAEQLHIIVMAQCSYVMAKADSAKRGVQYCTATQSHTRVIDATPMIRVTVCKLKEYSITTVRPVCDNKSNKELLTA